MPRMILWCGSHGHGEGKGESRRKLARKRSEVCENGTIVKLETGKEKKEQETEP